MKYSRKRYCRNCFYPLPYKARFCAQCGQKDTDGRARMKDLFHQVWFKAFHLESKFFLILWHLFIPGKVSQEFFRGKQKRYPPPVQFFFVVMFFFLLVFSRFFSPHNLMVGAKGTPNAIQVEGWTDPPISLERAYKNLYLDQQRKIFSEEIRLRYDSLPDSLRSPRALAAVDSILGMEARMLSPFGDSTSVGAFNMSYKLASRDIFTMDPEELLDKYGIQDWRQRIIVRQIIKFMAGPTAMLTTYIANLAWTIMFLIAIMAVVLKLLYWRQKRYYVEHFIFLLHQHTSTFWILTLTLLLLRFQVLTSYWIIPLVWVAIMPYFSMLRFYGQGWLKTLVKYLLFSALYGLGFVVLFSLSLVVVFILF